LLPRFEGRQLDAQESKVVADVERVGWSLMLIREEARQQKPGWAFTIGLFETYRHPEVVMFGLKEESRSSILNWIGRCVKGGKHFTAGAEHDWVLDGYPCWSRGVSKRWYRDLLGWAIWFYGGCDFPAVQCIWPDKQGVYPWQEQPPYPNPRPLLYEETATSARMFHYLSEQTLTQLDEWPFQCEPNTGVYVSRCVVEDGAPIVRVYHDKDGDWQFIGPVQDANQDGCKLGCFHCTVEREPSLRALASLPEGWMAWRESPSDMWQTGLTPESDE